jgi:hypothetical protein
LNIKAIETARALKMPKYEESIFTAIGISHVKLLWVRNADKKITLYLP